MVVKEEERLSVERLQTEYAGKVRTPLRTVEEVLERIGNGPGEVWITVASAERLRRRASELEFVESATLPLFGIPFAVKDNIDVAGLPTTAGCPAFSYVPGRSSRVVEVLEASGAICVGKTNMDQFATGLVGTRTPYGACGSVFDREYISGGSSSGSAVAVASGMVSFSLGTDTAGSGRVPAAFNGIVGLKPSRGLLSTRGVVPACRSLDCVSIFAGSIAEAECVLETAGVEDPEDPFSRARMPGSGCKEMPVVGVPREDQLEFFGDALAEGMFSRALAHAEELGWIIERFDYQPFAECAKLLYGGPWVAERFAAVGAFIKANVGACDPTVAEIIMKGESIAATELFEGIYRLHELKHLAGEEMAGIDFLMLPSAPSMYRIDEVLADPIRLNSRLGTYTNFVNLLDLSALAIPAGMREDGLPFGVTLVGGTFDDLALTEYGRRFVGEPGGRSGSADCWKVVVCGAHLSGQPLNYQLTDRGATLVRECRTSATYRLFALDTVPPKPGLIRDPDGSSIEVEIWEMPKEEAGGFIEQIPAPLCIGSVELEDGERVQGFLCEADAVKAGAREITELGGWRAFVGDSG